VLDQTAGEPSTLVPVHGTVIVHNRSDSSASATVVLDAEISPRSAGMISAKNLHLTLKDTWKRTTRQANANETKLTRSGTSAPTEAVKGNPFREKD